MKPTIRTAVTVLATALLIACNGNSAVVSSAGPGTTTGGTTTGGTTTGGTTTGGTTTGGTTTGGTTTGGTTTGGTTTGGTTTGGTTTGGTTGGSTGGTGGGTTGGGGSGPIGTVEAARFLTQATFGATRPEILALSTQTSFDAWLAQQRAAAPTYQLPYLQQRQAAGVALTDIDRRDAWFRSAVAGPDQLRQRMAFALSEIFVVSENAAPLNFDHLGLANYYDLLTRNALGSFRSLLEDVTLSPQMGFYLSMLRNQKPNPATGIRSDENYAREVMQLFTVGLHQLNLDGTARRDSGGNLIPTYTQRDVENLARVFTGFGPAGASNDFDFLIADPDRLRPMSAYQPYHDVGAKTIIGNQAIAAGQQALPELRQALDVLFNHPNVGPFISRQLIQRLVTANPSPAYVQRVAAVFNDNGSGVRGDLGAVAVAILTDLDARGGGLAANPTSFGKVREPLIRLTQLWRVFKASGTGGRYNYKPEGGFVQAALVAPSVFNWFQPDHSPVGGLASAGLVSPEFQITNEATYSNMLNELHYRLGEYRSSNRPSVSTDRVLLDYRDWEALARTPSALIDELNLTLMSGQMPAAMRNELISFTESIPVAEDSGAARVNEAVYLITTSAQFAVQR